MQEMERTFSDKIGRLQDALKHYYDENLSLKNKSKAILSLKKTAGRPATGETAPDCQRDRPRHCPDSAIAVREKIGRVTSTASKTRRSPAKKRQARKSPFLKPGRCRATCRSWSVNPRNRQPKSSPTRAGRRSTGSTSAKTNPNKG